MHHFYAEARVSFSLSEKKSRVMVYEYEAKHA
jgi:hypothetical protein